MKKLFYSATGLAVAAQANLASAKLTIDNGQAVELAGGDGTIDKTISVLINTFTQFLTLIAVVYAIWGGFTILTAAGDDEKVKTGRTIIFHAILGLVVIWLAYAIIAWVVAALLTS